MTVLFCDVVAYTELATRLDPEALRNVMSFFFEFAADTIERHGGTVEKFIGDEVMAVFGVPAVREDDALRAIRAALELRKGVATLGSDAAEAQLEVRIGINSGEVVAGDPAAGHGFVTGEAIAIGKRLQQRAGVGEILLGERTYRLVAHAVSAQPLKPSGGKGKAGETRAFRLDSVDEGAAAVPRRDDALLIGREHELETLRDLYAGVAGGAGARLVTIIGEPGIGKSRLGREFVAALAEQATVLVGRCPPYGEGVTFWPLHELLRHAGRDVDEAGLSSHEVFAAARRILEELAAERPLIAVFDDLHWAEPTFLDFIEYLAARLGPAPVLLLCLGRPQLSELRSTWLQPPAVTLMLEPLSAAESQHLLAELGTPPTVRARIAEAAEGNPLFVEQLAAIAGEHDVGPDMPDSIRGVLHERIDRLEREERALLERAAIAGRSFTLDTVLDLTPADDRDDVYAHLLALSRKKLLRPDVAAPGEGFRFHHALIRDAAYDGITKSARAEMHEQVAALFESYDGEDALVGYHLEQAYRYRADLHDTGPETDALGRRAAERLEGAATAALRRSDAAAAVGLFRRATALPPVPEGWRARLLTDLAATHTDAGELTDAERVLGDAQALAAAADDDCARARVLVEGQILKLHRAAPGATKGVPGVIEEVIPILERLDDHHGLCRAWQLQASADWLRGHVSAAAAAWERAESHARQAGDDHERGDILTWIASSTWMGTTPVDAGIARCEEIQREVQGHPGSEAAILRHLGSLHGLAGRFELARSLFAASNAAAEELGIGLDLVISHPEAIVEMLAGDFAAAERVLRRGYELLESMGEKELRSTTAALLARAVLAQGRHDEAEHLSEVSEELAEPDDVLTQILWRGVQAKLLAERNQIDDAERLAHEAVALAEQTDLLNYHADALADLAAVLETAGREAEAASAIADAARLYEEKGSVVAANAAHARLDTRATI